MNLSIFFDGASQNNPGNSGAGYLIYESLESSTIPSSSSPKKILKTGCQHLGTQTNNYAEYTGLQIALEYLIANEDKYGKDYQLEIFGDSLLVVNQLRGIWQVKSENLIDKYNLCKNLLENNFKNRYSLKWIPRSDNIEADFLARKASKNKLTKL
jgi:ribonuclease HI